MRSSRYFFTLSFNTLMVILLSALLNATAFATAKDDIIAVANSVTNNSLQTLVSQKSQIQANPRLLNTLIQQKILTFIDIQAMSKLALGGAIWKRASGSQRQQFTQGFKNMLVRTYSKALFEHISNNNNINYTYKAKRAWVEDGYGAVVGDIIKSNGRLKIKYDLRQVGGRWKAYNIHIEGIDYIKSFRNSFQREIKTSSLDSLIARLQRGDNIGAP